MITVRCLQDLERFGIVALTGEADALNYRILCDLTEQGCEIVAEAYGLKPDAFLPAWNPSSTAGKHVGCVLLSQWQQVGIIALQKTCQSVVVVQGGDLVGIGYEGFDRDEQLIPAEWAMNSETDEFEVVTPYRLCRDGETYPWREVGYGKIERVFRGRMATRNTHAMSGRTI